MDETILSGSWFQRNFPKLPAESRSSFLRETGRENLMRLQFLSAILIFIASGFLLFKLPYVDKLITVLFALLAILAFMLSRANFIRDPEKVLVNRLPVMVFSLALIWWSAFISKADPLQIGHSGYYLLSLFVVFALFVTSAFETFILLLNGILGFYLFIVMGRDTITIAESIGYLFFIGTTLVIASVLYHARLVNFLNWENISAMNQSLKREVVMHNSTLKELEAAKNDLDRQVIEKTRHLRDTNQKLQEEIAERNYSDKIKGILYRISGYVNQNNELKDVFSYIQEQLSQILDVSNLMIGIYDSDTQEIIPAYQVDKNAKLEKYRLGRTLSSYIIRNRKSLLVDKKGIHELVAKGEIESYGVPADSWLGVPLMVETRIVGILMVQSFDPNCTYDRSDLQLLEYVGEHLAAAIDRHETEEKLIRAKDQAEESDRLKSSFLANLSHEVRTPMNAIVGFTELLSESDLEATERSFYSAQILENGHKLLNTLTNMVELAKIHAKQMTFELQEVSVVEALTKQIEEFGKFKSLYNKPSLDIVHHWDAEIADSKFIADPLRFNQLFICIAENAVKFTHQGTIEIGCQKFDNKNHLFWIKDTGIGMADKELHQVFNWFTKGEKASEKLYRGTGLGLTIAKLMVENMKGRIWVESEPGKGSCFYFTLPSSVASTIKMVPNLTIKSRETGPKSAASAG
jgi:signal transduction histidine kinase